MISRIITDFRNKGLFTNSNEVDLFRNLALAIQSHSHSTFIDETHGGNVCNVRFISVIGRTEICEIADLLIISIAPDGALRATFWYAKKLSNSKWLAATTGNKHLDFGGQFNQWDLLCRRPAISGVGRFQPPPDLLSSFSSASIGSFGVFLQRIQDIEVSHAVAEFITCNNPTARHSKLTINGYLEKYFYSNKEIIMRPTIKSFLEALFAHQVGALLDRTVITHRWLVAYIRAKAAQTPGSMIGRDAFDSFLHNRPPNELDMKDPKDGLSVLIIGELNEA